jgi:cysteine desulfurase
MTESTGEIYLDHHATTPVDPRVAEAVMRHMVEEFGNANSVDHVHGERAAAAIEAATDAVADLLAADSTDVHFTSGSTQAIELAFSHALGTAKGSPLRVALSRVEHPAVMDVARRAEGLGLAALHWIDVAPDASIDLNHVEGLLPEIDLLCLMAANNEVGTIYPVAEAYERAAAAGVAMLVDATQAVGRVPLDLSETPFDYLVFSGHKIHAPKGVGALVSSVYRAEENFGLAGCHAATPNVPGVVGLGIACRLMAEEGAAEEQRLRGLSALMLDELRNAVLHLVLNGSEPRLGGNLHVSAPGAPNDLVVARLRNKVAISTGAACMSGAQGASHVLQAMGLPQDVQESALRIGLGRNTTREDVIEAAQRIASAIASVRISLERQNA